MSLAAATTTTTTTTTGNGGDESNLLDRLQSQFGDMDLADLLQQDGRELEQKEQQQQQEQQEQQQNDQGNENNESNVDERSDESSIEEPSPEELAAWQARQFQKGQEENEVKKRQKMTPLQRRRRDLKQKQQRQQDEDGWEQVASLPDLDGQTSIFFPKSDKYENEFLGIHPLLQKLAQDGDPDILGTKWKRLYSSSDGDGLSFVNLLNTIRGYQGPTVMLIGTIPSPSRIIPSSSSSSSTNKNDTNNNDDGPKSTTATTKKHCTTIGFFTTSGWEESTDMFGSNDCFLFSMDEDTNDIHFFRPKSYKGSDGSAGVSVNDDKHYMYCHPSSLNVSHRRSNKSATGRTATTDGRVHGIGIGGTPAQPRLHITESLEECRAMEYDVLFDDGDLLLGHGSESLYYFDVDDVEIWGVGGTEWIDESIQQQRKERDIYQSAIIRARKVDKKQFLDDFRLGTFHGGSGSNNSNSLFDHVQHTAGRCDI